MPDWRGACGFAQRGVMRGGGRGVGGEEERRSAEAASGALWKGPAPKAGRCHRSGTTPHYTRCAMSAKHDA